mmetsp:Transcript_6113/g.12433  ORF Transcript_6113/g.12433 Transcript_6113/m.12433 type:complete len:314 (-) Transcript_6113:833-1774(-)
MPVFALILASLVYLKPYLGPSFCQRGPGVYPGMGRLPFTSILGPVSMRPARPPSSAIFWWCWKSWVARAIQSSSRVLSSSCMKATISLLASLPSLLYPRISWMFGECTSHTFSAPLSADIHSLCSDWLSSFTIRSAPAIPTMDLSNLPSRATFCRRLKYCTATEATGMSGPCGQSSFPRTCSSVGITQVPAPPALFFSSIGIRAFSTAAEVASQSRAATLRPCPQRLSQNLRQDARSFSYQVGHEVDVSISPAATNADLRITSGWLRETACTNSISPLPAEPSAPCMPTMAREGWNFMAAAAATSHCRWRVEG